MGRVEEKVALVTGGARGMGAEFVRLLSAEGARVVIADVLDADGTALADELGERAVFVHLDVTSPEEWTAAVATAVETFGHLDVLVNNAGIVNGGPIDEYTLDQWNTIIAINLTGPFLGIKAAVPELKKSALGPAIVNVSSIAGIKAYEGVPGYVASKWGLRGLSKEAALDLAKYGIRVNSVHPGVVATPMTAGADERPAGVAMHRLGRPRELATLVLFLASDEASFVTGAEFVADGGETAGVATST